MTLPTCPVCGTPRARVIVYGLIAGPLNDPDAVVGGCIIEPAAPDHECRNRACRARFRERSGRHVRSHQQDEQGGRHAEH